MNLQNKEDILKKIDRSEIRDDLDIQDIYQEMLWTIDGYIHMEMMGSNQNPMKIKTDFEKLISLWESAYCKFVKSE